MYSELKYPVPAMSLIPIAIAGKAPSSFKRNLRLNPLSL